MKSIYTLIPDVQELLTQKGWWTDDTSSYCTSAMGERLRVHYSERDKDRTLRLSRMGDRCRRQVWYEIHHPDYGESLSASATFKYAYGHLIEALAITLAKAAGHTVEGEQDAIILDGVSGHCDCLIDNCIVDVKSSSTRGMAKYKDSNIEEDDPFGYLDQIDGYVVGDNQTLALNEKKNRQSGFIWAIDKTLGNMTLYEHHPRKDHITKRIRDYKHIVSLAEPPECTCETVPRGPRRDLALGVNASYSPFKHICFPGLRTEWDRGRPIYYVN